MKAFHLYILRHGLTDANREGRYIGVTDLPLNDEGKETLRRKKEEENYPQVEKVYVSPLLRAVQTAGILFPNFVPEKREDFRELDFGQFENKKMAALKHSAAYQQFVKTPGQAPPGGEEPDAFFRRIVRGMDALWRDMMEREITRAALVTHAAVVSLLLALFGMPRKDITAWPTRDGEGYHVVTTTQMWLRDGIFEIQGTVPFKEGEEEEIAPAIWADVEEEE